MKNIKITTTNTMQSGLTTMVEVELTFKNDLALLKAYGTGISKCNPIDQHNFDEKIGFNLAKSRAIIKASQAITKELNNYRKSKVEELDTCENLIAKISELANDHQDFIADNLDLVEELNEQDQDQDQDT